MRVVLDTNVLLSLWAFTDSKFAPLRQQVEAGEWVALTTDECLAEFRRVLGYEQFGYDEQRQAQIHAAYAAIAQHHDGPPLTEPLLPRCRDRDDQKFLELARDGGAEWLISADKDLLRLARRNKLKGLFYILKPDAALAALLAAAESSAS
ncbi:MAG TPA: putative toxin-antitoxin system toxin component, PIN family [Rhodocyclaceae bacterium]